MLWRIPPSNFLLLRDFQPVTLEATQKLEKNEGLDNGIEEHMSVPKTNSCLNIIAKCRYRQVLLFRGMNNVSMKIKKPNLQVANS